MEEIIVPKMTERTKGRSEEREREEDLPLASIPSSKKRAAANMTFGERNLRGSSGLATGGKSGIGEVAKSEWQIVANRITLGDIDELLETAQRDAEKAQGSMTRSESVNSQLHACPNSGEQQGSGVPTEANSQTMREDVRRTIEQFLRERGPSCALGDLGQVLWDVLMILEKDQCCRPWTSTGGKSIFPLPVSGHPMVTGQGTEFLKFLAACLNSMYGLPGADRGRPSSLRALKRLREILASSAILREPLKDDNFDQLFSVKGVDYQGEEIRLARNVVWESIEASLPDRVGMLDLREFCEGGVLHYINHFEDYVVPPMDQRVGKSPRVFVDDAAWPAVVSGLLDRGICVRRKLSELHHVAGVPLVNGLFSVSKDEFCGTIELCRLIMNLKPINQLTRSLEGDTCTLPMITQLAALYLDDGEILATSSEDLRCYFYLFAVPEAWIRYLGFGKVIPQYLIPLEERADDWVLCSRVLPMGFLNSVAIAQHIHRNIVRRSMGDLRPPRGAEGELRRDKPFSHRPDLYRVYLDNFDELRKLDRRTYDQVRGTPSHAILALREAYAQGGLPTHPKKTVEQEACAEVQGAWIDGINGTMSAKPSKIAKYVRLGLEVLRLGKASQKELQVVCGGLVYAAMFKRPLLGALNQVWHAIVALDGLPRNQRFPLRREVLAELTRFLGLLPLAFSSFRQEFDCAVSASDASMTGGGFCISKGLTPYGASAAVSRVRGDIPEQHDFCQVLSVGLFDGISALRVALDALNAPMAGHVSVEANEAARRVVEANFPDTIHVHDVCDVTEEMVLQWSLRFSNVGLILVGSGPPCQGVSGLNADRRGALRDARSSLFWHVPRIANLCKAKFPWAQVKTLTENVASMDAADCQVMNDAYGLSPWYVDAAGISLAHRPRLYWCDWELREEDGVRILQGSDGRLPLQGEVLLNSQVDHAAFLEPGACLEGAKLPTFTTARPSDVPMRKPAGLRGCQDHEVRRWKLDRHRFPPYQYKDLQCVRHQGELRTPNVREREAILGFPVGYTMQCMKKSEHGSQAHEDCRLTLLGNSWCVGVVAWLIGQLLVWLGLIESVSLGAIVTKLTPGKGDSLPSLLTRPPFNHTTSTYPLSQVLVRKLAGLTSLRGEDIMVQGSSEIPLRYHRLRASIPASLWRWRVGSGWRWTGGPEHINVLEARAVLTTLKWRTEQLRQQDVRVVHLVDSLVVLHCLTRGRSSSKKLRRTVMKIGALLLATGLQPLWGYVDTHQNPADRPSRWGLRKRWLKRR